MLEHMGIINLELGLMTTYLMERHKYVKVQHFCLSLKLQPNCSVVQGSKLSSTIYTECTLDKINISSIPTDTIEFKQLVKKDLTQNTPTKAFHFGFQQLNSTLI